MSGGGGSITGNNFLDMGVMVGASILAPELAPEFLTAEEGGLGLSAAAASGITGAALGGAGTALVGGNPLIGALGGGLGGFGAGGGFSGMFGSATPNAELTGLTTAPGGGITAAAPQVAGPQVAGGSILGSVEEPLASGIAYNAPTAATTGGISNIGAAEAADAAGYGGSTNGVLNQVPGAAYTPTPTNVGPAASTSGGWFSSLSPLKQAAVVGGGGLGAYYLLNQDSKKYGIPASATQAYTGGNLAKFRYDPNQYTPDTVQPPRPVYSPDYSGYARPLGYAGGGLMDPNSEPVDFMGGDMYPQSQQQRSYYATPTQMPTSAQAALASYEPKTNPLTGEPTAHMAGGGIANLGGYSDGGRMLKGPGDGMSDSIPASINGKRPARLADGEFVVPADVVSHIGNGSTDAGAKKLYSMMNKVRKARTGKTKQAPAINPSKYVPA